MKKISREDAMGDFFNTLCQLTTLLQGGTWRFWHGALKKFLQMKPPFVADKSDVSLYIGPTTLSTSEAMNLCKRHFDEDVFLPEAAELLIKHATAVQSWGHNFVIGTHADLFGLALGAKDEVFYDEKMINTFGLAFCEPSDAILIRAKMLEQEPGDSLCVMTRPLEDDNGGHFYIDVLRYVSHHPMPEKFRVVYTETQPQFSRVGRVMVFRLKE